MCTVFETTEGCNGIHDGRENSHALVNVKPQLLQVERKMEIYKGFLTRRRPQNRYTLVNR